MSELHRILGPALALALCACGEPRTPSEAAAGLRNGDADERAEVAEEMRDSATPRELVPTLIAALAVERNPRAKVAMLGALGRSGAPEARPWLEAFRSDRDPEIRAAADAAIKDHLVVTGEVWPTAFGSFPTGSDGDETRAR